MKFSLYSVLVGFFMAGCVTTTKPVVKKVETPPTMGLCFQERGLQNLEDQREHIQNIMKLSNESSSPHTKGTYIMTLKIQLSQMDIKKKQILRAMKPNKREFKRITGKTWSRQHCDSL